MYFPTLNAVLNSVNVYVDPELDITIWLPDHTFSVTGKITDAHIMDAITEFGDYYCSRIDFEALWIGGACVWICAQKNIDQIPGFNKKGE